MEMPTKISELEYWYGGYRTFDGMSKREIVKRIPEEFAQIVQSMKVLDDPETDVEKIEIKFKDADPEMGTDDLVYLKFKVRRKRK